MGVPLIEMLGYPRSNRAEEFPVFGYEGRTPLRAKPADFVLFDSPEHHQHRAREHRGWVADHALLVVELKRPGESLDHGQGQAQFYSHWAKVPFYATTNGEELVVYRMQGLFDDVRDIACPVEDVPRNWGRISALLGYRSVLRYCSENRIKSRELPGLGYSDYLRALYAELSDELELSMERTVSADAPDGRDGPAVGLLPGVAGSVARGVARGDARNALGVVLSGNLGGEPLQSAPYGRLLEVNRSVVVLSEPGGGKTHLTQRLARDLVRATEADPEAPVPVVLKARSWDREFGSVAEGVRKEIASFAPGSASVADVIDEDVVAGRFVVLIDGLDEAPREAADLLRAELLRVAGRTETRLIATCRKQDYRQELRGRFDECSIDPLTDEQIAAYASRELAGVSGTFMGAQFLRSLGRRLAELVRTPLFLVMTVAVMKARTDGRVPENRAELYREYVRTLLTEWERARMTGRPFEVDPSVKAAVLSEYARETWKGTPDDGAFADAVLNRRRFWDGERVRDELLRSGLLRQDAGGPEFFHPSFREYFFALGMSERTDDELSDFTEENHSDDTLAEVFAFLVGMLGDERRQAMVLNRLEVGNIYVFGRCLRTRTRFGDPVEPEQPGLPAADPVAKRYLGQLRATHDKLTRAHFGEVRHLLAPWRFLPAEAASGELAVEGYLDVSTGDLGYELKAAASRSPAEGLVSLGLDHERGLGERRYHNLYRRGAGLDSAREAALEDLTKSVEKLLKKKRLPLGDNHPLGVEYVEEQLRKLRNNARQGWVPREFESLSLRRSADEVLGAIDHFLDLYGGSVTFAWERDPSIGGHIETHADLPRMREYLGRLTDSGLDPRLFLPPERDVSQEELRRISSGSGSVLVDKWYSDTALASYIGRFYDLSQSAYRWIAEHLFPSLKDHLGFYRVGPVRHHALIFRNMREGAGADPQGKPSWVFVNWEPVASEAEAATVCRVTYEWPTDEDDLDHYDRAERALRELGRASTTDFAPMWSRRSHALTFPMVGTAVHDEVYKRLETELVKYLMQGKGGRLP